MIEPELLFDVLSRHHKIMKICEDISFILITLELYSIVLRLENKKDEEITKKLVTINGIMKTYKRSRLIVTGCFKLIKQICLKASKYETYT